MIVVTRHKGLVEWLRQKGFIGEDVRVIEHATVDDVRGEVVVGVLPLHLAAEAEEVWAVELNIPPEMRGKELTAADIDRFAGAIRRYKVVEIKGEPSRGDQHGEG